MESHAGSRNQQGPGTQTIGLLTISSMGPGKITDMVGMRTDTWKQDINRMRNIMIIILMIDTLVMSMKTGNKK